ncbi:MAG: murein hydrolase activator EnvC family protein, partial [Bacteroidota bacterium]
NNNSFNKLMFVFSSTDFNQAYQRIKYLQQINFKRRAQAEAIVAKQKQLSGEKQELILIAEEKNQLLGSEEKEKNQLAKEKDEQEEQLSKLSEKEKKLKNELEEKKKDVLAIDKKIKEMIAEIALKEQKEREARAEKKKKKVEELAANTKKNKKKKEESSSAKVEKVEASAPSDDIDEALSADFASNKGKLPWPVANGVITEGFGPHQHPKIKEVTINNSGVDITSTTKAANARSIFGGEVTLIAPMPDGDSKIVIVRHGNYLSVYTNLQKVNVKQGDKVTLKQNIGEILYSSETGGTTLNLQIWKGQTKLNPEDWLFKGK